MKKYLLKFVVLTILFSQVSGAFANTLPNDIKLAIKKYRAGNYSGCLQDCQNIVYRHPSNALAYYYMAMAYVQSGRKDDAIRAYTRVLSLNPSSALYQYAAKGKRCLENPSECNPKAVGVSSDLDKFINQDSSSLSPDVQRDFEQKHLDRMKEEMNNSKQQLNNSNFQGLNSPSSTDKLQKKDDSLVSAKPSQKEIDNALQVLKSAGIEVSVPNTNENQAYVQTKQKEIADAVQVLKTAGMNVSSDGNNMNQLQSIQNASQANSDLMQVQALLSAGQSQNNNGNNSMDMLPYMMLQNKDGKSNYSPQMVQALMMNSMMSNFNFNTDDNDNK